MPHIPGHVGPKGPISSLSQGQQAPGGPRGPIAALSNFQITPIGNVSREEQEQFLIEFLEQSRREVLVRDFERALNPDPETFKERFIDPLYLNQFERNLPGSNERTVNERIAEDPMFALQLNLVNRGKSTIGAAAEETFGQKLRKYGTIPTGGLVFNPLKSLKEMTGGYFGVDGIPVGTWMADAGGAASTIKNHPGMFLGDMAEMLIMPPSKLFANSSSIYFGQGPLLGPEEMKEAAVITIANVAAIAGGNLVRKASLPFKVAKGVSKQVAASKYLDGLTTEAVNAIAHKGTRGLFSQALGVIGTRAISGAKEGAFAGAVFGETEKIGLGRDDISIGTYALMGAPLGVAFEALSIFGHLKTAGIVRQEAQMLSHIRMFQDVYEQSILQKSVQIDLFGNDAGLVNALVRSSSTLGDGQSIRIEGIQPGQIPLIIKNHPAAAIHINPDGTATMSIGGKRSPIMNPEVRKHFQESGFMIGQLVEYDGRSYVYKGLIKGDAKSASLVSESGKARVPLSEVTSPLNVRFDDFAYSFGVERGRPILDESGQPVKAYRPVKTENGVEYVDASIPPTQKDINVAMNLGADALRNNTMLGDMLGAMTALFEGVKNGSIDKGVLHMLGMGKLGKVLEEHLIKKGIDVGAEPGMFLGEPPKAFDLFVSKYNELMGTNFDTVSAIYERLLAMEPEQVALVAMTFTNEIQRITAKTLELGSGVKPVRVEPKTPFEMVKGVGKGVIDEINVMLTKIHAEMTLKATEIVAAKDIYNPSKLDPATGNPELILAEGEVVSGTAFAKIIKAGLKAEDLIRFRSAPKGEKGAVVPKLDNIDHMYHKLLASNTIRLSDCIQKTKSDLLTFRTPTGARFGKKWQISETSHLPCDFNG